MQVLKLPRVEILNVSRLTSAENELLHIFVTVWQHPFIAILSPIFVSSSTFVQPTVIIAPFEVLVNPCIKPISSIIPVNINTVYHKNLN